MPRRRTAACCLLWGASACTTSSEVCAATSVRAPGNGATRLVVGHTFLQHRGGIGTSGARCTMSFRAPHCSSFAMSPAWLSCPAAAQAHPPQEPAAAVQRPIPSLQLQAGHMPHSRQPAAAQPARGVEQDGLQLGASRRKLCAGGPQRHRVHLQHRACTGLGGTVVLREGCCRRRPAAQQQARHQRRSAAKVTGTAAPPPAFRVCPLPVWPMAHLAHKPPLHNSFFFHAHETDCRYKISHLALR